MLNSLFGSSSSDSKSSSKSKDSATSSTADMAADTETFTISTITRGMCLETRPSGVSTGKYDRSGKTQTQLWTIEKSEDGNSVAFKSVANGQYLRSNGKGDAAKALTGDKSWWTIESGDSPGAWWLKNGDFNNYLCNYYGKQGPNNLVQMWSSNLQGWNYTLQWYINDSKAPATFSPPGSADDGASKAQREELEAKEKALQEREQKIEADEKDAIEREKAVAEREQKAEARVKAIAGIESSTKQWSQDVEAREKALDERTKGVEEREQAIAKGGTKENNDTEASEQVTQLQRQLADTQRKLEEAKSKAREQTEQIKRLEAEPSQTSSTSNTSATTSDDEANKFRERIKSLEAQLAARSGPTTNPSGSFDQERKGMKPIVIQNGFGFLPRLTDSTVKAPLPTDLPPRKLPPVKPPTLTRVK